MEILLFPVPNRTQNLLKRNGIKEKKEIKPWQISKKFEPGCTGNFEFQSFEWSMWKITGKLKEEFFSKIWSISKPHINVIHFNLHSPIFKFMFLECFSIFISEFRGPSCCQQMELIQILRDATAHIFLVFKPIFSDLSFSLSISSHLGPTFS